MQFMNYAKSYKFTIAAALAVIILLLLPAQFFPRTPHTIIELDKVVHGILFGIVTAVFSAEHFSRTRKSPPFLLTLFIFAAFAMLTETSQLFTRTRKFDLRDFAADMVGIAAALLLSWLVALWRNARSTRHAHRARDTRRK